MATSTADRDDRLLLGAVAFFTVAVILHGADHARRGFDVLSGQVYWLATAAMVLEVGVVVLACRRHRLAPLAAVVAGVELAVGYLVVHFLPARSWFSDSFPSLHVGLLTWAAGGVEVASALVLVGVGLVVLRHRGGRNPTTPPRPLSAGLTHPVALAMIAGNIVLLAISVVQRA